MGFQIIYGYVFMEEYFTKKYSGWNNELHLVVYAVALQDAVHEPEETA